MPATVFHPVAEVSNTWVNEFWRLVVGLLAALLAGLIFGHVSAWLLLSLSAYAAWHAYQLYRLHAWLHQGARTAPPESDGIWGEVFHGLHRLQQRNRNRKRRLATIVDSDEILVMLEGKIAERGTHQQLMAVDGWYAQMFTMQLDEVDATLTEG